MPENKRYSDYDDFAWLYNRHWGNQFKPAAIAALERLVLPRLPASARILDLCCGTGQLMQELSRRGYRTIGLDGSAEMLRYARENSPDSEFLLDDARAFKNGGEYDAVTCMFDALNHVMTLEELGTVFRNVYDSLKAGGLFLFDMNLEPGYLANWHGWNGIIEEDHVCIFPNSYNPETHTGKVVFTLFRLEGGAWIRSEFTLTQRCYSHEELLAALRQAGFARIEDYSYEKNSGLAALTPASFRAFFLCRKT